MKKFLIYLAALAVIAILKTGSIRAEESIPSSPDEDTLNVNSLLKGLEESYYGLDYKKVIDTYQPMLDSKRFTQTRFRYFVVFSELNDDDTYDLINGELRNVSDAMQDNYVKTRPSTVTGIILFKGTNFYQYKALLENKLDIKNVKVKNTGYHSQKKRLIVMRYIPGKGTILHEATHKFMKADFEDAPIWFDEGLASLHEASTYSGGKLTGNFSLRLLTLKTAMVKGTYKSIKHLMEMDRKDFYAKNSLLNYAHSRYLVMFLQEKGILERYYKLFRDTFDTDETGIEQLESLYGKKISQIELDYIVYIYSFKGVYP